MTEQIIENAAKRLLAAIRDLDKKPGECNRSLRVMDERLREAAGELLTTRAERGVFLKGSMLTMVARELGVAANAEVVCSQLRMISFRGYKVL